MGVVSGIVMSYQFGTNWSVFSDRAGPIIGPLMAYEVLTAFFLEAGFLGVMLFGMNKVGKGLHFAATLMVAIGTFISAFWILSVNSWMQTPTGWALNEVGQFVPAGSWLDIVFNPSFPYRLVHTVIAAYLTTALVVGGVGAWHLLKGRDTPEVRTMFSMAMWMVALVAPVQIFVGDQHGLNTLEHQPAKIMAMEGHFQSHPDGAPLILFGIPDSEARDACAGRSRSRIWARCSSSTTWTRRSPGSTRYRRDRPAGRDRFLVVPDHGRARLPDARARPVEPARAAARQALRMALASPLRAGDGARRLRRGDRGLGHHRGRPPALGDLRSAPHPRRGLADRRAGRDRLADRLRPRLFHRLRRRHLVHPPADGAHGGPARRDADPHRGITRRPRTRRDPEAPASLPAFQRKLELAAWRRGDSARWMTVMDLTIVWAIIIAFAVAAYVVMDGFDLGIGILFPRLSGRSRSATRR